ncbi:MAG: putative toxin-antitoxin system toxin component, PIN family [Spirosoma sp.]|nr:putative toxin-antitoxin system toxin component, PIN family [Spirosoma sp.]
MLKLYRLFEREKLEWVVSNEILTEYGEKLIEKYSVQTADLVLTILTLAPNTLFQEAYYNWQLIEEDPDDNKFVDVAIAAGADYLITNDSHFRVMKRLVFPKVNIVSLTDFLDMISED